MYKKLFVTLFLVSASLFALAGSDLSQKKSEDHTSKNQPVKEMPLLDDSDRIENLLDDSHLVSNELNTPAFAPQKQDATVLGLKQIMHKNLPARLAKKLDKRMDKIAQSEKVQSFHTVTKITFLAGCGALVLGTTLLILGIVLGSPWAFSWGITFLVVGSAAIIFAIVWELIQRN